MRDHDDHGPEDKQRRVSQSDLRLDVIPVEEAESLKNPAAVSMSPDVFGQNLIAAGISPSGRWD